MMIDDDGGDTIVDRTNNNKKNKKKILCDVDKSLIYRHLRLNYDDNRRRNSQTEGCDFLGANRFGKTFLAGKGCIRVESLRGKIIGLFFPLLVSRHNIADYVPPYLRQFYTTLKKHHASSFEMIIVLPPQQNDISLTLYNKISSLAPCPVIHLFDKEWRLFLYKSYCPASLCYWSDHLTFIDTKPDDENSGVVSVLPSEDAMRHLRRFGPQFYPFTEGRIKQLDPQGRQLFTKTSIEDILGSETRDYLINNKNNKVPISRLQNKDVLLYAYSKDWHRSYIQQLREIYNQYRKQSFEVVSINLDYNGGPEDEKSFSDHLAQIPWLSVPFGDDKIWVLRDMILGHDSYDPFKNHPILYVKPKGESFLDPYGFKVLKKFGVQAFPFTRQAAAHSLMKRQKEFTFNSFVDKAAQLGLDFNSLIRRNTTNGKAEDVSLSTIVGTATKGILLLFACPDYCSSERLNSLITAYNNQKKSNAYEVIYVSTDKDTQPFGGHFSAMPWLAFPRPLTPEEHRSLTKETIEISCMFNSHFVAFGSDGLLVKVGLLAKSFENCDFPFLSDAEWADHLTYSISCMYGWRWKEDGLFAGDGWWSGLEDFSDPYKYLDEDSQRLLKQQHSIKI